MEQIKARPSDEWYTDPDFLELCLDVFGTTKFFDPCLAPDTPAYDVATNRGYYDARNDSWHDAADGDPVFLNPAYSKPELFIRSFIEYTGMPGNQGILLVNSSTAAQWYQEAVARAVAVCFPSPRIRFMRRPVVNWEDCNGKTDEEKKAAWSAEQVEATKNPWGLVKPSAPRYNNTVLYMGPFNKAQKFCRVFEQMGATFTRQPVSSQARG